MHRGLLCLALGLGALLPLPAQAATMDEPTKSHLRCGSAYLLVADDPEMDNTPEEAARLQQMGEVLMIRADAMLTELGMDAAERERLGGHYAAEMDAVLSDELDIGFDPSVCAELVAVAEAALREAEIDKLMVCGAGFLATAQITKTDGDAETAEKLEAVGNRLLERGDDLMVEAGMGESDRYELGRSYGKTVWTKIFAGEALAYDWESCAALDS